MNPLRPTPLLRSLLPHIHPLPAKRAPTSLRSFTHQAQPLTLPLRQTAPSFFAKSTPRTAWQSTLRSGSGSSSKSGSKLGMGFALSGLGLGTGWVMGKMLASPVYCESPYPPPNPDTLPQPNNNLHKTPAPAARSILSPTQLTFGTLAGICAGVFVKKGAKSLAFLLGGVWVLMQYFSSRSFLSINYPSLQKSYATLFPKSADGSAKYPTVGGVYQGVVDFVMGDFQQRATFLAGFALGLRIG